MNRNIEALYNIAQKQERTIIGLMSGTSMDGLDIALCRFRKSGGETEIELVDFDTISFAEDIKDEIRKVFAKKEIDFQQLCVLNPWIGNLHGQLVNDFLASRGIRPNEVDVIASHGQTVFHAPKILHGLAKFPNATLQIGDGDHLAVKTGIITLSDFRQKHCAAGGEGAPLAVYGDYLIFSKRDENRILLNMGGIANFTYLAGNLDANEVFATDTGPGNTIIDAYMKRFFNLAYDKDAQMASEGTVNEALLQALKQDDFFGKGFPKTTGPELFNLGYLANAQQKAGAAHLSHADILATLCRFSADTIAGAILKLVAQLPQYKANPASFKIYGSGGGVHNPLIMQSLKELLPAFEFYKTDDLGISGDAKEAVLFATLANEALVGGRTDFGARKGVPGVSMGKVSFPN
ncbi:anhydro-N-acetylmuramic acid kinase [Emticicia sp. 21SJ11W-3]|uniref:anhydro-N-acetylmuramic acid kinase n=1 Tax=Emticicia sp. 21SJ11W-3 TaxID=2916755 RepID=UPI0020A1B215|nr:anhydro-N-acetylmuramic acid kinase [Emticicia sp. 21SJ11W-3]UTA68535.1 anhydro-N-acetylmuramic acid kinase [Emticicia sp. 21SJ11W-3]